MPERRAKSRRTRRRRLAITVGAALFCLAFASTAFGAWKSQQSGSQDYLSGLSFATQGSGWAVGTGGTVLRTDDEGATWTRQTSGTTYDLSGVEVLDSGRAWVVGDRGTILTTGDAGQTWLRQPAATTSQLLAVDFVDAQTGWVTGDDGVIFKTTDGGASWARQTSGETRALTGVSFRDATHGIIVGDLPGASAGRILRTDDGGAHWTVVTTPAPLTLYDITALDATHAWAVGDEGTILKSVDDGQTWTVKESSSHYSLDAVAFTDATNGWAVGSDDDRSPYESTIRRTSDGGETWRVQRIDSGEYLYDVAFTGTNVGYACGSQGTILRAVAGGDPDGAAPVTSDDAPAGWARTPVNVNLTAHDEEGGSGIAETRYAVDGDGETAGATVVVPAPADGSNDGVHTITYYSVDQEGNREAARTATVRIDASAPQTTDDAGTVWSKDGVTVQLTASDGDDASGVTDTQYRLDEGDWQSGTSIAVTADGVHTLEYRSADGAGNLEQVKTATIRVERVAPVTSDDAPADWQTSPVTVTLTPSDEGGSSVAATRFTVDNGEPQEGTSVLVEAPSDHSNDGTHTITYYSVDAAGNEETVRSCTVMIDTTPPGVYDDAPEGWSNSDVQLHLTAADAGSRLDYVESSVDGGPWQMVDIVDIAAPADHTGDGVHEIAYRAADRVGNVSLVKTCTVRMDTVAPQTSDDADDVWHNAAVTVQFAATDDAAGVDRVESRVDDGSWQSGPSITIQTSGEHRLDYRAIDAAGNVEAIRSCNVRIDTSHMQGDDNAMLVINGGSLLVQGFSVEDFPNVMLDGTAKTLTAVTSDFQVVDARGTGTGWRLSIAASQLREWGQSGYVAGGDVLPQASLELAPTTVAAQGTPSDVPDVTDSSQAIDVGAPIVLASAAPDEGMGSYKLMPEGPLTLSLPADAYAGTYRSVVTLTVTSGP
jgi:photosystem II stability/assembly factor-like uncharacterized protein